MNPRDNVLPREERGFLSGADGSLTEKLLSSRPYQWTVDGIGNNLFSLVFSFNEYFIAGLSLPETIRARAAAFLGNMVTGRPYAWFRDKVFEFAGVDEESPRVKKALAETVSFALGQAPIYAGYLITATARCEALSECAAGNYMNAVDKFGQIEWNRIATGAATLTLFSPLYGPGQGYVQDKVRHAFGLKSAAERNKKKVD